MLIGLLVILLAGGALLFFSVRRVLVSEFDSALHAQARALASLVRLEDGRIEVEFSDEFMPAFERKTDPEFFQIWLADGQSLERSRSLARNDLPSRGGSIDSPEFWDLTLPDGRAGRAASVRFDLELEEDEGAAVAGSADLYRGILLTVAKGRAGLDGELRAVTAALLSICVLILAGTAVVVNVVVRKGLRPLQSVGDQAAAIGPATLDTRFPAGRMPSELRPICDRLNELLARLEISFQRERRFNSNVAHELRTPIAELRAMAEVALKYPPDGPTARAGFQDALQIALRLEGIITSLLALARHESGTTADRHEQIDLADLVDQEWKPLAAKAAEKKLALARELPPGLSVRSGRAMLGSILRNLLSNAVEYSPAGGRIDLTATTRDGEFQLTLSNPNPGLSRADLPQLFEPFWRKDSSRTDASHSGLGLTLAADYAHALSMDLDAVLTDDHILCLVLRSRPSVDSSGRQGKIGVAESSHHQGALERGKQS